jgi:hypothetical protein
MSGIVKVVAKLSEDDSNLVDFLNNMSEVMLRLKAQAGDPTSILIQYYDQLKYLGCDAFSLFIIFVKYIIVRFFIYATIINFNINNIKLFSVILLHLLIY